MRCYSIRTLVVDIETLMVAYKSIVSIHHHAANNLLYPPRYFYPLPPQSLMPSIPHRNRYESTNYC